MDDYPCKPDIFAKTYESAALTPPNEWVAVEDAMPPEHEPVLCIVDGKPKPNITLEDAYQIGSWNKADGWIIDEYLDWEDADVSWWVPLPAPPDKDNNVPAKTPNEPLPVLVNDEQGREYIDYICPRCKEIISQRRHGQRMETVYQCRYHDNCGQRVDWSSPQPYRRPPEGEEDT